MKRFLILFLLALTITQGWAQQVFVNPTSVTLTRQGCVTVIITGKINGAFYYGSTANTTPDIHVTVGTITASYTHQLVTSMAELSVVSNMTASSVATGTLDTGTYPVISDSTIPIQVTVILWTESTDANGGAIALSDLTLSYDSATSEDKAAFQTLIVSLVQQQLDALQGQITAQQNQINSLDQLVADQQSALTGMQNSQTTMAGQIDLILSQLAALQTPDGSQQAAIAALQQSHAQLQAQYNNLQNQTSALQDTVTNQQELIDSLHQSLTVTQSQYSQLSESLTSLTTRVDSNSTTVSHSEKSDDTLAKIGIGLGAAGVISGIVNFFIGDGGGEHLSTQSTQDGSHK